MFTIFTSFKIKKNSFKRCENSLVLFFNKNNKKIQYFFLKKNNSKKYAKSNNNIPNKIYNLFLLDLNIDPKRI